MSPKKRHKSRSKKFCQKCKTHGGTHQTNNTTDCHHWDKDGKPLGQFGAKLFDKHKPYKKNGGKKELAYLIAMLKAIQKGQKKLHKVRNARRALTNWIVF